MNGRGRWRSGKGCELPRGSVVIDECVVAPLQGADPFDADFAISSPWVVVPWVCWIIELCGHALAEACGGEASIFLAKDDAPDAVALEERECLFGSRRRELQPLCGDDLPRDDVFVAEDFGAGVAFGAEEGECRTRPVWAAEVLAVDFGDAPEERGEDAFLGIGGDVGRGDDGHLAGHLADDGCRVAFDLHGRGYSRVIRETPRQLGGMLRSPGVVGTG